MEGGNPVDRLHRAHVRRAGQANLFGDRRLVEAVDCFVGESAAGSDADQLEKILLIFY